MQKQDTRTHNPKIHSAINVVAIIAMTTALTAALICMQLHATSSLSSSESVNTFVFDTTFSSENGKATIADGNTERVPSTLTNDVLEIDNTNVYFIRQFSNSGSENFSFSENIDKNGVKTYGYQLNRGIEELSADGSILFTNSNIIAARTFSNPNYDGKEEYCVAMELSDTDAATAVNTAISLLKTQESVCIYHNQKIIAVEPVTDLFGDGELILSGFADYISADGFVDELHICTEG